MAPEPGTTVSVTTAGPLKSLFDQSRAVLEAREMEFEPLLPPDEATLDERVEALGAWAQGFLYGFGAAGPFKPGTLPRQSPRSSRISPKSRAPAPSAPRASKSKRARSPNWSSSSASACSSSMTSSPTCVPPRPPRPRVTEPEPFVFPKRIPTAHDPA